MSEKLELGKYKFYPNELKDEKKTPEEISETLEKLLEKSKRLKRKSQSKVKKR